MLMVYVSSSPITTPLCGVRVIGTNVVALGWINRHPTVNEDTELNVIKCNELGNELGNESEDDDEIEGLTIISHHESEPANRLASLARIKRRHTSHTGMSKWLAKIW